MVTTRSQDGTLPSQGNSLNSKIKHSLHTITNKSPINVQHHKAGKKTTAKTTASTIVKKSSKGAKKPSAATKTLARVSGKSVKGPNERLEDMETVINDAKNVGAKKLTNDMKGSAAAVVKTSKKAKKSVEAEKRSSTNAKEPSKEPKISSEGNEKSSSGSNKATEVTNKTTAGTLREQSESRRNREPAPGSTKESTSGLVQSGAPFGWVISETGEMEFNLGDTRWMRTNG